jgi:hypothetical protein
MSKRQRDELRGYVAFGPNAFRALLFLLAVGAAALTLRAIHRRFVQSSLDSDAIWLLPSIALAVALYRYGARWTGGRAFRAAVRRDLARGEVAVHRVVARDAIGLEQQGDEGPAWFIRTDDDTTILFAGQYLETYVRKGFPWTVIDIVETPEARVFLRLESAGEKLAPSVTHAPSEGADLRAITGRVKNHEVVDLDFDALKEGRLMERGTP